MLDVFTNLILSIDGHEITFGMRTTTGYVARLEENLIY